VRYLARESPRYKKKVLQIRYNSKDPINLEILAKNDLKLETDKDEITKEFKDIKDHLKINTLHRFQNFLLQKYKYRLGRSMTL
jgi:hypothetical protein